jgi:signal peptidase I
VKASTPAAKRGLSTGAIVAIVAGGVALVLVVVAGAIGFILIRNTMRFTVPGASMEPTIRAGQTVSATKVDPGKYQPKRGDIVVFRAPEAWTTKAGEMFVKRVIGLPGERVACCDPKGSLYIDTTPLAEPYLKAGATPDRTSFDIKVPDGRLWVMGDNRAQSGDSLLSFMNSRDINLATIPVSSVSAIVKP